MFLKRLTAMIVAALFLSAMLASQAIAALEVWVCADTGDNANQGTELEPFETIPYAIGEVADGGTIHVMGAVAEYPLGSTIISITKSFSLLGPNADISPNDPGATRVQEAVVRLETTNAFTAPSGTEGIDFTFSGFTVECDGYRLFDEDNKSGDPDPINVYTFDRNIFNGIATHLFHTNHDGGGTDFKFVCRDNYFDELTAAGVGTSWWPVFQFYHADPTTLVKLEMTDNVFEKPDYAVLWFDRPVGGIFANNVMTGSLREVDDIHMFRVKGLTFRNNVMGGSSDRRLLNFPNWQGESHFIENEIQGGIINIPSGDLSESVFALNSFGVDVTLNNDSGTVLHANSNWWGQDTGPAAGQIEGLYSVKLWYTADSAGTTWEDRPDLQAAEGVDVALIAGKQCQTIPGVIRPYPTVTVVDAGDDDRPLPGVEVAIEETGLDYPLDAGTPARISKADGVALFDDLEILTEDEDYEFTGDLTSDVIDLTVAAASTNLFDVVAIVGDGSEGDPFQITTWSELYLIGRKDNIYTNDAHYLLMNDLTPEMDCYDIYAGPLANDGKGWIPIGGRVGVDSDIYGEKAGFSGVFDGGGHEIRGLYANWEEPGPEKSRADFVGFIGLIGNGGEVRNLTFSDIFVKGGMWVAPIGAVEPAPGTLYNVHVTSGTIHAISTDRADSGGLVGSMFGGTIEKCSSAADVTGESDTADDRSNVGGLLGVAREIGADIIIRDSYAIGNVHGNQGQVGGLIGHVFTGTSPTIERCYSTGEVTTEIVTDRIGGLIGSSDGTPTVTASFWNTETSGLTDSAGGTGITSLEMYDIDTFLGAGWDIDFEVEDFPSFPYLAGNTTWLLDKAPYGLKAAAQDDADHTDAISPEAYIVDMNEHVLPVEGVSVTLLMGGVDPVTVETGPDGTAVFPGITPAPGIFRIDYEAEGLESGQSNWFAVLTVMDGDGSAGAPFEITIWAELSFIGFKGNDYTLEAHYILMNDLTPEMDGYDYLAGPTAHDGKGFIPIGGRVGVDSDYFYGKDGFTGVFDGGGNEIRGLYANWEEPGPYPDYTGAASFTALIGYVAGGVVRDLTLSEIFVKGGLWTGGVVGELHHGGIISNVHVTSGTVHSIGAPGTLHDRGEVGGLVGQAQGEDSLIEGCSSAAVVIGDGGGGDAQDRTHIGGLVGQLHAPATIRDSFTTGSVHGAYGRVGGLVGASAGTIVNSYAAGNVTGEFEVGGLVGWNPGAIESSYAAGNVTGGGDVGGLVGWNTESGTIVNAYAAGAVTGVDFVGGLAGFSDGMIENTYSTGAVTGEEDVGGLIGGEGYGIDMINGVIASFWNTETSGQDQSAGGTGITSRQMYALATFEDAGWDIAGEMSETGVPTFPYLANPDPVWKIDFGAQTLAMVTQPEETAAGNLIGGPPAVQLVDDINELEIAVEGVKITVSLAGGAFDGATVNVATDAGGLATFDRLMTNTAGTYTLLFAVDDLEDVGVESDAFDVLTYIQYTVNRADPGDTVNIGPGRHSASVPIRIEADGITLRATDGRPHKTTIDAEGGWIAVEILGDNVTLEGFAIQNYTYVGVDVWGDGALIMGNVIDGATDAGEVGAVNRGILVLGGAAGTRMVNNVIVSNKAGIANYEPDFVPAVLATDSLAIHNCIFSNTLGVDWIADVEDEVLGAEFNWWGDASGPGGYGPGDGDDVAGDEGAVEAEIWLRVGSEGRGVYIRDDDRVKDIDARRGLAAALAPVDPEDPEQEPLYLEESIEAFVTGLAGNPAGDVHPGNLQYPSFSRFAALGSEIVLLLGHNDPDIKTVYVYLDPDLFVNNNLEVGEIGEWVEVPEEHVRWDPDDVENPFDRFKGFVELTLTVDNPSALGVLAIEGDEVVEEVDDRIVVKAKDGDDGDDGDTLCFIATAAFGSPHAPQVEVLRAFRDRHLLTHVAGRRFVEAYYRFSPPLAAAIAERPVLRAATGLALLPVSGAAYILVNGYAGCLGLLLAAGLLAFLLIRRKERCMVR